MPNSHHLLLAIDLGASGSKIVGSIVGQPDCKAILMSPHCVEIEAIVERDPLFDEHNAWVKITDTSYAVGNLAKIKYNATNKLKPAKFSTAVPKICTAIAVCAQAFALPAKFDVSICFVLPPAEWGQASIVIERLQAALRDLETPKGKIKARLLSITPYPEGMGILVGQELDLKDISGAVTVIMLGFRNASVLSAVSGVVSRPHTTELGFHDLLMGIASKTGYKTEDTIEPILNYKAQKQSLADNIAGLLETETSIAKWDSLPWADQRVAYKPDQRVLDIYKRAIESGKQLIAESLNPLLRCTGADRQVELDGLLATIDRANKEYWTKLSDWLDENMPSHSSYICLAGGSANYFKAELELHVTNKMDRGENRLRWHTKVDVSSAITDYDDRFSDIYVLWTVLKKQYQTTAN